MRMYAASTTADRICRMGACVKTSRPTYIYIVERDTQGRGCNLQGEELK